MDLERVRCGPMDSDLVNCGPVDLDTVRCGPMDSDLVNCRTVDLVTVDLVKSGPVDLTAARGWTGKKLLRDLEGTPEWITGLDLEVSRGGGVGVFFTQPFKIRGRGGQKYREKNTLGIRLGSDRLVPEHCLRRTTTLAERRGTRCEPGTDPGKGGWMSRAVVFPLMTTVY